MKTAITAALIGIAAGLLGALCGVGGGILMVPAFTSVLGLDQKKAVATSLAVIVIIALISTVNNSLRKESVIDWKVVILCAVFAALAAWFGTDLMHKLSNQYLTRIFGIVLLVFGTKMLLGK
ncbi:sulfite exporter TauE/SafE family protein [Akkermansiaceae bacterium]|nr:sulfite exporter TauE/SafE family protein [Akkermansiaceae bacterium]